MDCGGGSDGYTWAGVAACCPSPEDCNMPVNCETWDECI
jgi:hypothetical protein